MVIIGSLWMKIFILNYVSVRPDYTIYTVTFKAALLYAIFIVIDISTLMLLNDSIKTVSGFTFRCVQVRSKVLNRYKIKSYKGINFCLDCV